jgi:hypothetical protein
MQTAMIKKEKQMWMRHNILMGCIDNIILKVLDASGSNH